MNVLEMKNAVNKFLWDKFVALGEGCEPISKVPCKPHERNSTQLLLIDESCSGYFFNYDHPDHNNGTLWVDEELVDFLESNGWDYEWETEETLILFKV